MYFALQLEFHQTVASFKKKLYDQCSGIEKYEITQLPSFDELYAVYTI